MQSIPLDPLVIPACLLGGRAGFSQIEAVSTVETLCFTMLVNAKHYSGQSKTHEMAIP